MRHLQAHTFTKTLTVPEQAEISHVLMSRYPARKTVKVAHSFIVLKAGLNCYQSGFQNGSKECVFIVVTDFLVVTQFVEFFFQELGKQ